MPDRYGESDEPVVDFDSRRQARELAAAQEAARKQRERLDKSHAVHAPLTRDQAAAARTHRHAVTEHADAHRNALRIANCDLCDDTGYNAARRVCDHIDHRPAYDRGMAAVRREMGWDQ